MATLIDRFRCANGVLTLRVQHSRTGGVFDVIVDQLSAAQAKCSMAAAEEAAGSIWGGSSVPYFVADGICHYEAPVGALSADEAEDFDFQLWAEAARKIAPDATDAQLRDIRDRPMSLSQRRRALEALA